LLKLGRDAFSGMELVDIVFAAIAVILIGSALGIVLQKNPVYSVVYMLPFFLGMTTLFVMLQATFLASIQMIVYGGAILVVFLFVIMLINLKPEELKDDFSVRGYALGFVAIGAFIGLIYVAVSQGVPSGISTKKLATGNGSIEVAENLSTAFAMKIEAPKPPKSDVPGAPMPAPAPVFGSINDVASPLFKGPILVPFELASILIVVAMLGAVLLSKKRV
jgi:NADH-quinone oxidoreductase subunit J